MTKKIELICKVWQAWANFTRKSWELVSSHEKGELTEGEYRRIVEESQECSEARLVMINYDCECDRRGIDWLNAASTSKAARAARREHLTFSRMIWEHLAH